MMTVLVRRTALQPLQAAACAPGILFEHNAPERQESFQWAAFVQDDLTGQVTYEEGGWVVKIVRAGYTAHRTRHGVYVTALAALQEQLAKLGADPGTAPRRH
jgi:hypothetical protein